MSDKFKNYLHDKLFLHKWLSSHYVTCSDSRVSEDDIEYIRKDIHDERIRALEEERDTNSTDMFDRIKELEAKVAQLESERNAGQWYPLQGEGNPEYEAKIVAEAVERCIQFVENGRFLHDDAPAANLARELVSEMRKQLLPTGRKG